MNNNRITFATLLTLFRIVLVPCVVSTMITQQWGIAFALFCLASVTDMLDGWVARTFDQETFLGAALDPLADKLLMVSVFATLAFVHSPLFAIPLWFVLFLLLRELIIIVGGASLYVLRGHVRIAPTLLGKLTMFMQVCFIVWLFLCHFFQWVPVKTYYAVLGLLFSLAAFSLVQYVMLGIEQMRRT